MVIAMPNVAITPLVTEIRKAAVKPIRRTDIGLIAQLKDIAFSAALIDYSLIYADKYS